MLVGLALLLVGGLRILVPDGVNVSPSTITSEPLQESSTTTLAPTTTTEMSTTTITAIPTTREIAEGASTPRSTTSIAPYASLAPSDGEPDDFWYALRTCESGNGLTSDNLYQFMGGTDEKVGIDGSEPEVVQTQAAKSWANALRAEGVSPGSNAGWPECWWIAGGN